jgi:hypothetical protein
MALPVLLRLGPRLKRSAYSREGSGRSYAKSAESLILGAIGCFCIAADDMGCPLLKIADIYKHAGVIKGLRRSGTGEGLIHLFGEPFLHFGKVVDSRGPTLIFRLSSVRAVMRRHLQTGRPLVHGILPESN